MASNTDKAARLGNNGALRTGRLLGGVALGALAAALVGEPAWAQCAPQPSGQVVCDGSGAPGSNGADNPAPGGSGQPGADGGNGASTDDAIGGVIVTAGNDQPGVTARADGGRGGVGGDGAEFGGSGGRGGDGGDVTLVSDADITTNGQFSHGLLLQANGGDGGIGGLGGALFNLFVDANNQAGDGGRVEGLNRADIATSGWGADGVRGESLAGKATTLSNRLPLVPWTAARGGDVTLNNQGAIRTGGDEAAGLRGLSRGGLGQNLTGGDGAGAGGGDGGSITLVNDGLIETLGIRAFGMHGASTGGRAGMGANGGGFFAAYGSSGGAGGRGGGLSFVHTGTLTTAGVAATGIKSESDGGLGGTGGDGNSSVGDGTGGDGGRGGDGGDVSADIAGAVTTGGDRAHGAHLRSTGGTGGAAGSGSGSVANGGTGGQGGQGGAVIVAVAASGEIITGGEEAHAVFAESRGGDGGIGGDASGVWGDAAGGGSGGHGGDVTVDNLGLLSTFGAHAYGVHALSAGGGGGGGGGGTGLVGLSGRGGGGSKGGEVSVSNDGVIITSGFGAHAVLAQSIGGGGGAAGAAAGLAAIGGGGGEGGEAACASASARETCNDGGGVTVVNDGAVGTSGDFARGIYAQSIGGGGGDGGAATGLFSLGGTGGEGGRGGRVEVINRGVISTTGEASEAIFAESVGGGGGVAGDATALPVAAGLTIGGFGGLGGDGGVVRVENRGTLSTAEYRSHAVFAQSVGGGGGRGGDATADVFGGLTLSIGGVGGGGGSGGFVEVLNSGVISTLNDSAMGIFAQSVGGGGGAGGAAYAETTSVVAGVAVTLGGLGGGGGDGGAVSIDNSGSIFTDGDDSRAIFAQSVGGGGGLGGSAASHATVAGTKAAVALTFSLGGEGGDGGNGGFVQVANSGAVVTLGDASHGVQAQSVGGGGGMAGDASAAATALSATGSTGALSVAVGGRGGGGGDGGAVSVSNLGSIRTEGERSYGIFAQSAGGGGGEGGAGTSSATQLNRRKGMIAKRIWRDVNPNAARAKAIQIGVAVGGSGGVAGHGGSVSLTNEGDIETLGYGSHALFAQSVGGGGGVGAAGVGESNSIPGTSGPGAGVGVGGSGGASGRGGFVEIANSGLIITRGHDAHGIFGQSVGGGGGVGDFGSGEGGFSAVKLAVGGSGGAAGVGGQVVIDQSGEIVTFGDRSFGVFAQSVGGGGGTGGAGANAYVGSIAVGGTGGAAGDGGDVEVTIDGDITTSGDAAFGVFAQSVGGGGGMGGDIVNGQISIMGFVLTESSPVNILGLNVAGASGNGGHGGDVVVTTTGDIRTTGQAAHGLFAQSVGGGGGLLGGPAETSVEFALNLIGSQGGIGVGGDVTVNHSGSIRADGRHAHAIFAQSVGGPTDSGVISQTFDFMPNPGDPAVSIVRLFEIFQRDPGDIVIDVDQGLIQGGTGAGFGIFMDGGANNRVTIGAGAAVTSLAGNAIRGSGGNDAIVNAGLVDGRVLLGEGNNRFDNLAGASFLTGDEIDLGGGLLTNAGRLALRSDRAAGLVELDGDLLQQPTGVLEADVGFGGAGDRLATTGSVTLGGEVRVRLNHLSNNNNLRLISAAGGATDAGADVDASDTLAVDYSLVFGANFVDLAIDVDFSLDGLRDSAGALGDHLNTVLDAGTGSALSDLMVTLGNYTDLEDYTALIDGLHGENFAAISSANLTAASEFAGDLMSCRTLENPLDEGQCVWGRATTRDLNHSAGAANRAFSEETTGFAAGGQWIVDSRWRLGVAMGFDDVELSVEDYALSEGRRRHLGLALKRLEGPWLAAAALSGGWSESETMRFLPLAAGGGTALSEQESRWLNLRLRGAWSTSRGPWFARTAVDLDITRLSRRGFTETGAGVLNLVVRDDTDTFVTLTPSLEVGGDFSGGEGVLWRPWVRLGAALTSSDQVTAWTMLEGTPAGVDPFASTLERDKVVGLIDVGVSVLWSRMDVRMTYQRRFGDRAESDGLTLRAAWRF